MANNFVVITDLLRRPFDEGAKNTAFNILKNLSLNSSRNIVSLNGDKDIGFSVDNYKINKTLLNLKFLLDIRMNNVKSMLYIPEASATLYSLLRSKIISFFSNKSVYIYALQPRQYSRITKIFIGLFRPSLIITPSRVYSTYLKSLGIKSVSIPLGVNNSIYREYCQEEKITLRLKYEIDVNKHVVLHVGHINESRNLNWLIDIKKYNSDLEVVLVGSTYNNSDLDLYKKLKSYNIKIIDQYVSNMVDIYNLANFYVFPVENDHGAISTPLSVLEAMSCNLPIITTKFGSLIDMFVQDDDFHFVESSYDITNILNKLTNLTTKCKNRDKVSDYTWEKVVNQIEQLLG